MTSLAEHLEAEACPHLAVFLRSADELPGVLVSFYALGLRRGGWLAHRALPGDAERERELLTEAGLDVAALESDGRMVVVEMDFAAPAEGSAAPWREALDAALARGCTGLWYARSPVGGEGLDGMLEVEREWHRMSRDRPVVTICPFIVGEADPDVVAEMHTGVLVAENGEYSVLRRG
jgi:MEDS: MEthanogen/methylotroph, DcmR Sensory domain